MIGGPQGIDAALQQFGVDALVSPTGSPAWTTDLINGDHFVPEGSSSPAAIAGYPAINVPMGNSFGLPVGITFTGTAFSEPTLMALEAADKVVVLCTPELSTLRDVRDCYVPPSDMAARR